MKTITTKSYAKINLSIDVIGKRPDGYHQVLMVMQQIDLFDFVTISFQESLEESPNGKTEINLSTDLPYLPNDHKNIAYKAALLMIEENLVPPGKLLIHIDKKIPVSAGLAGGSSNGAAVLHGINKILNLKLSLEKLMAIGTKLGADVPFCIMGQAALNETLGFTKNREQPIMEIGTCAIASGIGEKLQPVPPVNSWVLLSKPPISVSTAKVYGSLSLDTIKERPNTEELVHGIEQKNDYKIKKNMVNVLENVSLKEYPIIVYTKNNLDKACRGEKTLMSGSGPTVFALIKSRKKARVALHNMNKVCKENYLVKTL